MVTKIINLYKDSFLGHSDKIWVLAILTLINRMGTKVLPFLTIYLTVNLKFSFHDAGFVVGSFGVGSLIGNFFGGKLSDRFSPKWVVVVSLLSSGIGLFLLQYCEKFYSLFFLVLVTAIFGESYRPAISTMVGDFVVQEKVGRTMGLLRLAINLGMSASPALGGFIVAYYGYKWLFWIDGITCIFAALYFIYASRNWINSRIKERSLSSLNPISKVAPPLKNKFYMLFVLVVFSMGFTFLQWFHTVPVFIKSEWGFDERLIGILMGTNAFIITLIEMPLVHLIELKKKIRVNYLGGLILIGASFLPFLLPKMVVVCFLGILLLTIGEILSFPFSSAIALKISPKERRGEYMSWYGMAWSFAHIFAPAVGLTFVSKFGFELLWLVLFLFICIGAFIATRLLIKLNY